MSLTEEQIQEALKTDAVKNAIKEAVAAEVDGLKNKRDELLGANKDLKAKLKEIEDERDEAAAAAAAKSGNVEEVKAQLEAKHKKDMEALTQRAESAESQLQKHVISEGLTNALVKAKVKPEMMDAATALIKSTFKGEVGNNDGTPFAKFDGKAVDDFVTGWAESESGKRFVLAEQNSGGGSNGANGEGKAGTGKGKTMTRAEFDALSPMEKSKASTAEGGLTLTD